MTGKIKSVILLAAVWVVLVLSVSVFVFFNTINSTGFTAENKVARGSESIYITENSKNNGLIWKLDKEGRVTGFFSTSKLRYLEGFKAKDVDIADGTVRCIFQRTRDDNGRVITEYAIVIFNDDMEPTFITAPFRLDQELLLSGFTSTEDRFHLTAIPTNRKMAYVYRIYAADMIQLENTKLTNQDVEAWEGKQIKVSSIEEQSTETGRFIAEAEYDEVELHIRYDNIKPEYFTIDSEAGNLFNKIKPSLYQYTQMSGVNITISMIVAGAGFFMIILFYYLLLNRARIVYKFLFAEMILFSILAMFFFYHVLALESAKTNEYLRYSTSEVLSSFDGYAFTDIGATDLYATRDYSVIAQRQNRMINTEHVIDDQPDVYDVLVADQSGKVLISGDGRNLGTVATLFGGEVRELVYEAAATSLALKQDIILDGENYYAIATPLTQAGLNGYVGLLLARYDTIEEYFFKNYGLLLIIFGVMFMIVSIIIVLLNLSQHKDIRELSDALGRLSEGEEEIEKPTLRGRDMNYMWNSIYEIQKNILHTNRAKFLTYEAYYRFAPKGVEQILGKDSIMEVNLGDHINFNGTIAHIASAKQVSISHQDRRILDRFMSLLHETRKEYNGIFISHNNNLSRMKLLFMEGVKDTTGFGTDLLLKLREDKQDKFPNITIIMHYSSVSYGVVGTEECSSIFMVSCDSDLLQDYAEWFRNMRVSMILTEPVLEHEKVDSELRYIGFIVPHPNNPDEKIKLYEAFDAESAKIHSKRIATKERFAEALELFYKQDFYLARNTFTEILRESPEDEISKWYLFECENYLNEVAPENFVGAIHM